MPYSVTLFNMNTMFTSQSKNLELFLSYSSTERFVENGSSITKNQGGTTPYCPQLNSYGIAVALAGTSAMAIS